MIVASVTWVICPCPHRTRPVVRSGKYFEISPPWTRGQWCQWPGWSQLITLILRVVIPVTRMTMHWSPCNSMTSHDYIYCSSWQLFSISYTAIQCSCTWSFFLTFTSIDRLLLLKVKICNYWKNSAKHTWKMESQHKSMTINTGLYNTHRH